MADDTEDSSAPGMSLDNLSFKEAFKYSRAGGAKTFEWNGKTYTTDVAPAKAAAKAAAPAPARAAPKVTTGVRGSGLSGLADDYKAFSGSYKAYAKGGSVRGDGKAQRGKTKGRSC